MGQLRLINLLYSHNLLIVTILALEDLGKLALAKLPAPHILLIEAQIISLLLQKLDPIKYGFLILVVKLFWLHQLVLMRYNEPIVIRVLLAHNLGDIEASKWNYV